MDILIQIMFLILLFAFFIFFVMQFFNIVFRGFAPFISTRKEVINRIIERLNINDNTVIYELGCGRAGFLRAVRKRNTEIKLVGIEYSFFPYIVARIQNNFTKSNLKIIKENIFKADIGKANIIYCFLNRATMEALGKKFDMECKKDTEIVSYQFPLPNKQPENVLEVREGKDKVYFYKN